MTINYPGRRRLKTITTVSSPVPVANATTNTTTRHNNQCSSTTTVSQFQRHRNASDPTVISSEHVVPLPLPPTTITTTTTTTTTTTNSLPGNLLPKQATIAIPISEPISTIPQLVVPPTLHNVVSTTTRTSTNNTNTTSSANSKSSRTPTPTFASQVEYLIPANVWMISGCHSLETSADVFCSSSTNTTTTSKWTQNPNPNTTTNSSSRNSNSGGACTSALLEILYQRHFNGGTDHTNISLQELLLELRTVLSHRGLNQIPQLSSSRPIPLHEKIPFTVHCNSSTTTTNDTTGNSSSNIGTCRALLVGINYIGQSGQLQGCCNDCRNMKQYLIQVHGYQEQNILLLMDESEDYNPTGSNYNSPASTPPSHLLPTRKNIIQALQQLVTVSQPGDMVYFHFSGHGGLLDRQWNRFKQRSCSTISTTTTKALYDEIVLPLDHQHAGYIHDFSLFRDFVQPMSHNVTVMCVMDCCHSGSVLELPYTFLPTATGTIQQRQSFHALSNLVFLYLLAGGNVPINGILDDVLDNITTTTGESIDNIQGMGYNDEATNLPDNVGLEDSLEHSQQVQLSPSNDWAERDPSGGSNLSNNYWMTGNDTGVVENNNNEWVGNIDNDTDNGDNCNDCSCLGEVISSLLDGDE